MWGPQLSLDRGALPADLDLEEDEIDPFLQRPVGVPASAPDKAASRLLSAAAAS